jgi:quercetin dioxygenase-like cupin family protein
MNKSTLAVIAFLSGLAAATAGGSTPPPGPPILGSTSVSWEELEAQKGKIFRNPTATLDELEMHVTHLAPGKAPHPPHQHLEEEVVIIREGTLEAMQGGKTRKLGPGSVLFQASNQLHGVKNVGDVPAVYHVIRWASPGMKKAAATQPSGAAKAPAPAKP